MEFSFIIPAFNEEKTIGKCIKSIKGQTIRPCEIIVVDNNSSDKTGAIARKLGCTVVVEHKRGISNARNAGSKIAKGDVLCFIDADSLVSANWLQEASKTLLSNPKISAVTGVNVFSAKNVMGKVKFNLYTLCVYSLNIVLSALLNRTYLAGNNLAIKKEVFEQAGGFEPVLAEDIWFSRKFWKLEGGNVKINFKMWIILSPRGFENAGYIKTLLIWAKAFFIRIPQAEYTYKTKPNIFNSVL